MGIHDKYPNHWGDMRPYFADEAMRRFGQLGEILPREKAGALADWLINAQHSGMRVSIDDLINLKLCVEVNSGGRFKADAFALPKAAPTTDPQQLNRAGRRMKPWKRGKDVHRGHP